MVIFRYKTIVILILFFSCKKEIIYTEPPYEKDPLENKQWYLYNKDGKAHINLTQDRYKGEDVLIAIVDDGIDIDHEDLREAIGYGSYSYHSNEYNYSDAPHGTSVSGIIAARQGNDVGIRGIAPKSRIIGFNAGKTPSVDDSADALKRDAERIWVSNNSWGDFNSWGEPLGLRKSIQEALEYGTTYGRYGKGTVYVFSAGNGNAAENELPTDNVNYSGLVNNKWTIPVCAVNENNKKSFYSEKGATLVVCAPSNDKGLSGIFTTDGTDTLGYNPKKIKNDTENINYTKFFGGTSASAPMVSGAVALMLDANPRLGWRDVKAILSLTASKNDINNEDWLPNGAGHYVNHSYGFGLLNVDDAIKLSIGWQNFGDLKKIEKQISVNKEIPDNQIEGITSAVFIEDKIEIEFIDIVVHIPKHLNLGDLEIVLISPSEVKSILAERHLQIFAGAFRYDKWRFGSYRHLMENSYGKWKLQVRDLVNGNIGKLEHWKLSIWGH